MRRPEIIFLLAGAFALASVACENSAQPETTTPPPGSVITAPDTGVINVLVPGGSSDAATGAPPSTLPSTPPSGMDASPGHSAGNDSGAVVVAVTPDAGPDASLPIVDGGIAIVGDGGDAAVGPVSSGDSDFDSCYAQIKPVCVAKELTTAAQLETPCKAITNIPIPLTDGTTYGPKTIMGGPYAGKIDWNQGAGTKFVAEENELAEQGCLLIGIDTFAQPTSVNDEIKNTRGLDWTLFTVFRPACMKKGEKYPVITWANGTCGETHGYSALLATIASHGFVVVASNSTWTAAVTNASGTPVQVSALDYAEALNADMKSPLYQRLDMSKVGAMGHSQGAAATGPTAADPRVKSVIFWNTGTSNDKPFLNVSGEQDVGDGTVDALKTATDGATQPGAWIYYHKILATGGMNTGHLLLMEQPERVTDMAIAWWKWQLNGDQEAKKMFVGPNCGLCKTPEDFAYGANSKLQ